MKVFGFFLGIALSVLAFFAAALELAAHAGEPQLAFAPAFGEVWRVLSPDTLKAFLAAFAQGKWSFLLLWLLKWPGWMIAGVPGFALIVFVRPGTQAEDRKEEQSLFLFDELLHQARMQAEEISGDDLAPGDHADMDIADGRYAQDDIVDDIRSERDFLLSPARLVGKTHKGRK